MRSSHSTDITQVKDDFSLLELMMDDLQKADALYRPTNYWQYYENKLLPELKNSGLTDFRRRRNSSLEAFTAVDLVEPLISVSTRLKSRLLANRICRRIPGWTAFWTWIARQFADTQASVSGYLTEKRLRTLYFGYAEWLGSRAPHAKPLNSIGMSLAGNPEDVFEVDGRPYSISFVYQYLRYAFVSRHIDFNDVKVYVELGSGSGKQVELLKKLHPDATFILFDIPPQLYVAHQYLAEVFGADVVPYRHCRDLKTLANVEPGKIYILGTPQFPLLDTIAVDLFWNSASFQEMEPFVVENYLNYVNRCARHVFLYELMMGQELAANPGEKGVLEGTTLENYQRYLPDFRLVEKELGLPFGDYTDAFWVRSADGRS